MKKNTNRFFSDKVYEIVDSNFIEALRQLNYVAIKAMGEPGEFLDDDLVALLVLLEKERIDENENSLRSLGLTT